MWALGTEPKSSSRAVNALNSSAIPKPLKMDLKKRDSKVIHRDNFLSTSPPCLLAELKFN